jgi:transcriptional regulator
VPGTAITSNSQPSSFGRGLSRQRPGEGRALQPLDRKSLDHESQMTSFFLLTFNTSGNMVFSVDILKESCDMTLEKAEVLQGTLDLMVLKTLETMGPMHGFGIARRIEQVSRNLLQLNQGTLYPALLRLQQKGWITSKDGVSENNRRARFYSITRAGRRQLKKEAENWERMTAVIARLLAGNA